MPPASRPAAASLPHQDSIENNGDEETCSRVVDCLGHIHAENKWFLLVPNGSLPPARSKHAALSVGRRMFVLGGASADGLLDDVQVFHAERGVWLQLGCGSAPSLHSPSSSIPLDSRGPRCFGHCLAFWDTKLVAVGGSIGPKSQKLQAFALDLQSQSWSVLAPKGEVPVARTGQAIVQVGSVLVLFGGEDGKGQLLNDTYVLDLNALVWLPLKTTGSKPLPRRGHSAVCYDERYLFIFGGKANGNYFNDLHCLDLQSMEWTKERPKGIVPTGRAGHAATLITNTWYIVGGEHRGSEVTDTVAYNILTRSWSVVASVQPGSPLANEGLTAVKIRNKGKAFVVVFGGRAAALSNQVFVMMVSSSRAAAPPHRRRPEAQAADELSTSSLPFSFTTGSLQTIQGVLNSKLAAKATSRSASEDQAAVALASEEESDPSLQGMNGNEQREQQQQQQQTTKAEDELLDQEGKQQEDSMSAASKLMEARRRSEELLRRLSRTEKALTNVLRAKEAAEKRAEEALSSMSAAEREMEALAWSKAEADKRAQAAEAEARELRLESSKQQQQLRGKEQQDDQVVEVEQQQQRSVLDRSRLLDLQQRVQEAEAQIVFVVRKQAASERKLLAALKENRELKKRLLLTDPGGEDDNSGESMLDDEKALLV